jgi:hypothetical protein
MARYIHKIAAKVEAFVAGRGVVEGFLHLSPNTPRGSRPETILERLNSAHLFLPLSRAGDLEVLLLNVQSIERVSPDPGLDPQLWCPPTFRYTREERVRVRLAGGAAFEGLLQMELPEEYARVSDFMNLPEVFFPLRTAQGVLFVNKSSVADVMVYEAAPVPAGGDENEGSPGSAV